MCINSQTHCGNLDVIDIIQSTLLNVWSLTSEAVMVEPPIPVAAVSGGGEPNRKVVDPLVLQREGCHSQRLDGPQGLGGPAGAHAVALGGRPDPVDPFVDDVDASAVDLESGRRRGYHEN